MGYTVDLEDDDLRCPTRAHADRAVEIIAAHEEMHPYHLQVSAECRAHPATDDSWGLQVEHFQGDHWRNDAAERLWSALAPCLSDGSTIEFRGEDSNRWRIRWQGGRVFEEYVHEVSWNLEHEILPPQKENAS